MRDRRAHCAPWSNDLVAAVANFKLSHAVGAAHELLSVGLVNDSDTQPEGVGERELLAVGR